MTDFFATIRVPNHSQNLHVAVYFVLQTVEIRVLFSSLYLYFTLFLMSFSIKLSHRFGRVLSDTELSGQFFFFVLQNLNLFFALLYHSMFMTHLLLWLVIIFLFLLFRIICRSAFFDVLYLTVHEVGVRLFHFIMLINANYYIGIFGI